MLVCDVSFTFGELCDCPQRRNLEFLFVLNLNQLLLIVLAGIVLIY